MIKPADFQILVNLHRTYGVKIESTLHELRKKVWDNAGKVDVSTWNVDLDNVDFLCDKYPNEEPIETLL